MKKYTANSQRNNIDLFIMLSQNFYQPVIQYKIATPIIFQTIQQVSQLNVKRMIVGEPGISKSMSFILAWKLSEIVSEFRYKYPQLAQQIIQSKEKRQKFRKIIYINFKTESYEKYFESLIAQCPQFRQELQKLLQQYKQRIQPLSKQEQNKIEQTSCNFLRGFLIIINNRYSAKNIQCLIVMDQINTVASAINRYHIAKLNSNNKDDGSLQKTNAKQAYKTAFRLYNIFETVFLNMSRFIYNSSADIQKDIFYSPNYKYPLALDLDHHSPMEMIKCSFNQQSYKTFAQQLYYFFLYQIEKRLYQHAKELEEFNRKQGDNKSVKQKVQAILSKMAEQSEFFSYITPYSIRMAVSENFNKLLTKLLQKQAKEQQLQECIKQLINKSIIAGKNF